VADLEGSFVNEAKKTGVKHIVKLSALGGRKAIFPSLHRESEETIEASGVPYTFLRPNGFMQNFVNYSSGTINTQNAFYAAQGNGAVSHIDIRDIGAAAVNVLSSGGHEGKAYSLTEPEALTNPQVAERLSRAVGRTIRYVDVPPDDFKNSLLDGAFSPSFPSAAGDFSEPESSMTSESGSWISGLQSGRSGCVLPDTAGDERRGHQPRGRHGWKNESRAMGTG
jgi:uncharacterized protein YbjT (DUF2867 family)